MTEPLLEPGEAGERLGGVVEKTLIRWRNSGYGPAYVRVGRKVMYRPSDIDAWLREQTSTPTGNQ